jgi:hypothetical protein
MVRRIPYREQDRPDYLTKRQREQAFMYSFPTKKLDKPDAHVRRACKQPFSSGNPNPTVAKIGAYYRGFERVTVQVVLNQRDLISDFWVRLPSPEQKQPKPKICVRTPIGTERKRAESSFAEAHLK